MGSTRSSTGSCRARNDPGPCLYTPKSIQHPKPRMRMEANALKRPRASNYQDAVSAPKLNVGRTLSSKAGSRSGLRSSSRTLNLQFTSSQGLLPRLQALKLPEHEAHGILDRGLHFLVIILPSGWRNLGRALGLDSAIFTIGYALANASSCRFTRFLDVILTSRNNTSGFFRSNGLHFLSNLKPSE